MLANSRSETFLAEAEKVIKSIKFPSQPDILVDMQAEINQPEPKFKKIADMLSKDVGLMRARYSRNFLFGFDCDASRK